LDDLDELAGFVAAEANHAKDKKLQKELDQLCDRIQATLDGYTVRPVGYVYYDINGECAGQFAVY
jgi:plasmid stabilization system protein ParE